eukprot:1158294-Pelagomonas_calceolata.AAC.6
MASSLCVSKSSESGGKSSCTDKMQPQISWHPTSPTLKHGAHGAEPGRESVRGEGEASQPTTARPSQSFKIGIGIVSQSLKVWPSESLVRKASNASKVEVTMMEAVNITARLLRRLQERADDSSLPVQCQMMNFKGNHLHSCNFTPGPLHPRSSKQGRVCVVCAKHAQESVHQTCMCVPSLSIRVCTKLAFGSV